MWNSNKNEWTVDWNLLQSAAHLEQSSLDCQWQMECETSAWHIHKKIQRIYSNRNEKWLEKDGLWLWLFPPWFDLLKFRPSCARSLERNARHKSIQFEPAGGSATYFQKWLSYTPTSNSFQVGIGSLTLDHRSISRLWCGSSNPWGAGQLSQYSGLVALCCDSSMHCQPLSLGIALCGKVLQCHCVAVISCTFTSHHIISYHMHSTVYPIYLMSVVRCWETLPNGQDEIREGDNRSNLVASLFFISKLQGHHKNQSSQGRQWPTNPEWFLEVGPLPTWWQWSWVAKPEAMQLGIPWNQEPAPQTEPLALMIRYNDIFCSVSEMKSRTSSKKAK